MPQQRVQHRRPARADFAPARPRAVQQLEPVGLDLEKTFVARELLNGAAVRWQRQTRFGSGLYFFEQILHGRIKWAQNGFKARNAVAFLIVLVLVLVLGFEFEDEGGGRARGRWE
jgi:hypothetical protein